MSNDPKNPETPPTPIVDSEAPRMDPAHDHKVASNPPADEVDDPDYQSEESGE